ncbi:MSMEG_0570 family nitrogen starvation response protein [Streptomyces sp. NPDC058371]|uniref:MSMEG_0570 family nitrogen starvation response protein n=1 Tax=Streptomyces sp. NPDC058371 TaxID=3346463 RepID=UPI00364BFEF7
MPELYFHVRWPDGETQRCYSPSTVVEDYLTIGGVYELGDFLERSRTALGIASDRVREKYGFASTGSSDQLAQIEETAATYASLDGAKVAVEALSNADGSAR